MKRKRKRQNKRWKRRSLIGDYKPSSATVKADNKNGTFAIKIDREEKFNESFLKHLTASKCCALEYIYTLVFKLNPTLYSSQQVRRHTQFNHSSAIGLWSWFNNFHGDQAYDLLVIESKSNHEFADGINREKIDTHAHYIFISYLFNFPISIRFISLCSSFRIY